MAMLTRAAIEKASELKTEVVTVPEWGGDVLLRELTGSERDWYEASIVGSRRERRGGTETSELNLKNLRARLVGMCLIDPDTKQLMYSDQEIGVLGNKSAAALDRLFEACQRLSAITDADVKELEAVLVDDPNAGSGSGSHLRLDIQVSERASEPSVVASLPSGKPTTT